MSNIKKEIDDPYYKEKAHIKSTVAFFAIIFLVSGFLALVPANGAKAAVPGDFGLKEGDTISATGSDDPDVYIVNEQGFKRLFLNPVIFGFYGHLGGFAKVKSVAATTRDAFPTSGLFRLDGDTKVYGVETTGEDTGIFHWVNTTGAQAVADDANFFKKVFIINQNEFNWYAKGTDYTSVSQVPSYVRGGVTPPPVAGNVTVSLASSNPAAQTITKNAYGFTLMVLKFTGTGKVQELTFKRGGAGSVDDYDNLYIYDGARRLTGGRSPSSSDGTVTFISLKTDVSGTKELALVADHSATAGNVDNWELTGGKLDSGTLAGFPLRSNNFTVSGSDSGTINVDKLGAVANPKVGQMNAQISEFKVTANTEAAFVKRIQLVNGGSVKTSDITNLRLEVQGSKIVDGSMTSDGYAVFDFGTPGYKITKGDNKVFKMYADIAGKKDETIKFYQENATDVNAIGDQFGFGMKATVDANFDDSTNTHSLTLQGGVLTIAFNGPNASNVGTDTSDTVLARYSFTAAADIEVKKLGLVICEDATGDGTFDAAADTDGGLPDLDDVKIVDENSGQVVVGPSNGSNFTTSEATGCPDSATGASKIFTDTFDLKAGVTRNFKVTADIKTANADGVGNPFVSGGIIRAVLDGYGESDLATTNGDVAVMKYAGTNTAVDDSDIVPNTDLSGNNLTLQSSSLTLGLAASPISRTYVRGTKNIDAIGFNFTAANASSLKVTDIRLTGYVRDTAGDTITKGVDATDSGVTVGGLISKVALYDGATGTLIDDSPDNSSLNTTTGTITFNNLNWTIPAGATKRLLVKTDLSSNAVSGTTGDFFSFDIDATTDVTALDNSSKTVNAAAANPNPTNNTVIVTVKNSGSILVTADANQPITSPKYWGQTDAEFARYQARTVDEAFYIEKLTIKSGDTASNVTNNIENVKVKYTTEDGRTLTAVGSLDNNASVSFGFVGADRPYVPKDSSTTLIVLANMKTKAGGATSEVNFSLDFTGAATTDFKAYGAGSGTLIQGNDTTDDDTDSVTANNMYVYRVYPEFILDTLAASEPLGTKDVLKFSIKAWGLSDSKVLFDDATGSETLKFEVVASGAANASLTADLYDVDTTEQLASATITTPQDDALLAIRSSLSFVGTAGGWEKSVSIQGGTTKKFRVQVAFQNFLDKSDYFQLVLQDNEATLFTYVDGGRSDEKQQVDSVTSVFRSLPMYGPIFIKL